MILACGSKGTEEELAVGMVSMPVARWPGAPGGMGNPFLYVRHCTNAAWSGVDVVFSPQPYESSHLARTAGLIDEARYSIDIAMYGMNDRGILDALGRAAARGVSIRMILDTAREAQARPEGTMAARLDALGIEVRWINRIMHHKFAIIDGVRNQGVYGVREGAVRGVLVNGSANWSLRAGTEYDESTLFIRCVPELVIAFQREFDHLWANSRGLAWSESEAQGIVQTVPETLVVDGPAVEALFTSDNFDVYESPRFGPTFSWNQGARTVADRVVALIESAESSILLASAHLRTRQIAEALIAQASAKPHLDIRILLDGQEWVSEGFQERQERELLRCLAQASDPDGCLFGGLHFSYEMHRQGIPVRFKYYSYRWHYLYALQMHHKFMVVDGRFVVTGSYNLSENAETNTMENLVILDGLWYPGLVDRFEDEFERLWDMERDRYEAMLAQIRSGTGPIALVFEPMALTWRQVDTLRRAIRAACPAVDSGPYREDPVRYRVCYR